MKGIHAQRVAAMAGAVDEATADVDENGGGGGSGACPNSDLQR